MENDDKSIIDGLNQIEVADNYNKQTRENTRKIRNVRPLLSDEEREMLGNQSSKLVQKRLLRRFLIGIAIGAFSIVMVPVAFPLGIIATAVAIPYTIDALNKDKFKGKIGKALQRYITADDYKEKLQAQIDLYKNKYNIEDETKQR